MIVITIPNNNNSNTNNNNEYVPDRSKLGQTRYVYRTCTQTWLNKPLLFKS